MVLPFFDAIVDLDLEKSSELIDKITNDEFIQRALYTKLNFFDLALKTQSQHEEILLSVLKGRLDEKDPRFKDLAENLIAKINAKDSDYVNENTKKLYEALCITPNNFQNKFRPKSIDKLKA